MNEVAPGPPNGSNHERLNGWKEIAAHFGKSVRSVQRWERELGMPVHRLHSVSGEIVFARRSELEQWENGVEQALERNGERGEKTTSGVNSRDVEEVEDAGDRTAARTEGDSVAAGAANAGSAVIAGPLDRLRRWGTWAAAVAVVVVAVLLWGGWRSGAIGRAEPKPASLRVEDDTLKVFDARKERLWEHHFDFDVYEPVYTQVRLPFDPCVMQLEDLDQDGQPEVLFVSTSPNSEQNRLYCFNSDARRRFSVQPSKTMTFGGEQFSPPYLVRGFKVTSDGIGRKAIWVTSEHNLWFPSVLQKVLPNGEILGEYWSNGHINNFRDALLNGRRVMLVGAMNNESWTTSLAVLDYDNPTGYAPAATAKYRCENCKDGGPLAFLKFPRTELSQELDQRPVVREIRAEPNGNFIVSVVQAFLSAGENSNPLPAAILYTLNNRLEVIRAEASDTYREVHSRLELAGRLKHRYGPACVNQLLPVQMWNGKAFEKVRTTTAANPLPEQSVAQARR